jgi:hypothetical protein
MADGKPGKPYPPRWAMIYLMVLILCLIVWIILDVMHGVRPGNAVGDRGRHAA